MGISLKIASVGSLLGMEAGISLSAKLGAKSVV